MLAPVSTEIIDQPRIIGKQDASPAAKLRRRSRHDWFDIFCMMAQLEGKKCLHVPIAMTRSTGAAEAVDILRVDNSTIQFPKWYTDPVCALVQMKRQSTQEIMHVFIVPINKAAVIAPPGQWPALSVRFPVTDVEEGPGSKTLIGFKGTTEEGGEYMMASLDFEGWPQWMVSRS